MKLGNRRYTIGVLVSIVLLTSVFCSLQVSAAEQEKVCFIYSREYEEDSQILTLDESLNETGSKDYSIANLNLAQGNAVYVSDSVFLIDIGNSDTREDGKVLEINRSTGEEMWYDLGRTNITSAAADEKYIYAVSNVNQQVFIDRMDRESHEITTIEPQNMVISISKCGDDLAVIEILGDSVESVCIADFEDNSCRTIVEVSGEIAPSMAAYEDRIYYSADGKLYAVSPADNSGEEISLEHGDVSSIQISGTSLYAVCGSVYDEGNTYIETLNLETMESETIYESEDPILQLELESDTELMIADYEKIFSYDIESKEITASFTYDCDEYYFGGFYLTDN